MAISGYFKKRLNQFPEKRREKRFQLPWLWQCAKRLSGRWAFLCCYPEVFRYTVRLQVDHKSIKMDENSSAKLGAHTHKVKNEVTMFILFEFFGCYGFPMFFYSISGLTPKRQHMLTRFLFRWSFVGNSSSSLGETSHFMAEWSFSSTSNGLKLHSFPYEWTSIMHQVHCDHSMCSKKTGISMSFPTSGNKLHNAKFMMYFIPPTLFYLYSSCSTNTGLFQKVPCTLRSKTLWRFWGPLAWQFLEPDIQF